MSTTLPRLLSIPVALLMTGASLAMATSATADEGDNRPAVTASGTADGDDVTIAYTINRGGTVGGGKTLWSIRQPGSRNANRQDETPTGWTERQPRIANANEQGRTPTRISDARVRVRCAPNANR